MTHRNSISDRSVYRHWKKLFIKKPARRSFYRTQALAQSCVNIAAEVLEERTMLSGVGHLSGKPEIVSPFGNISNSDITIEWTESTGDVSSYQLLVYSTERGRPVAAVFDIPSNSADVNLVQENFPSDRAFQMFVRGVNSAGIPGPYSNPEYVYLESNTILSIPDEIPIVTGPASTITETRPTISWTPTAVPIYDVQLYSVSRGRLIFEQENIYNETDLTLPTNLATGDTYQVFVRSHDSNGSDGIFSHRHEFTIVPSTPQSQFGKPEVTGPAEVVNVSKPTISWNASQLLALEFNVLIYSVDRGQEVVNLPGLTGSNVTLTDPLPVGETYQTFVQARNIDGTFSEYSDPYLFFVESSGLVPEVRFLNSPFPEAVTPTPTFTWFNTSQASRYELLVYNMDTGQEVFRDGAIVKTVYTIQNDLPISGHYQAFVRGFNSLDEAGGYSNPYEFDAVVEVAKSSLDYLNDFLNDCPKGFRCLTGVSNDPFAFTFAEED